MNNIVERAVYISKSENWTNSVVPSELFGDFWHATGRSHPMAESPNNKEAIRNVTSGSCS